MFILPYREVTLGKLDKFEETKLGIECKVNNSTGGEEVKFAIEGSKLVFKTPSETKIIVNGPSEIVVGPVFLTLSNALRNMGSMYGLEEVTANFWSEFKVDLNLFLYSLLGQTCITLMKLEKLPVPNV